MRTGLLAIALVVVAAPALAQTPTAYDVQFYQPGVNPATGSPFQTDSSPASAWTCNQAMPPLPSSSAFIPKRIAIPDPANSGQACILDRTSVFAALPILATGTYVVTVTLTDDRGLTSPRSPASNPFPSARPPNALTGVRVLP